MTLNEADSIVVQQTVQGFFDHLGTGNEDSFESLTSHDFIAFDEGERYDRYGLLELIRSNKAKGLSILWFLDELRVEVRGSLAWSHWMNRGEVGKAGVSKRVIWLESAVLRRDQGRWVVCFLHSTRMRTAA